MIHNNIKLATSNKNKIEEFKRFGLTFKITEGKDLKEVDSNIDDVILYKTLDAGNNILVEDSVLIVDGKEIVDIRWKINELKDKQNPKIQWIVSLGIQDNNNIYIYRGIVDCQLVDNIPNVIPDDAFGFDPYLKPINNERDFYTLNKLGLKDEYSPRKIAIDNLLLSNPYNIIKTSIIPAWNGKYQNENNNLNKNKKIKKI